MAEVRASRERLDELFEEVKNWGRWGPEDQRGALNWITNERRVSVIALQDPPRDHQGPTG